MYRAVGNYFVYNLLLNLFFDFLNLLYPENPCFMVCSEMRNTVIFAAKTETEIEIIPKARYIEDLKLLFFTVYNLQT